MRWLGIVLLFLANSAAAQTVVVKSGDHADFTRLVLTFPVATDWRLGRTENGYELQRPGRNETFDLSDVYRLITKERLKSVWADPVSGRLQLGVGCVCHAIPFEFNANTLVIDIREGAPPAGSAFEQSIETGAVLPALGADAVRSASIPTPGPTYDWLPTATAIKEDGGPQAADNRPTATAGLEAELAGDSFRNAVIDQLAKGATDGVVTLAPEGLGKTSDIQSDGLDQTRIMLGDESGELPGVSVTDGKTPPSVTAKGTVCPRPETVDLASWSAMGSDADALMSARNALLGEFDEPIADGVQQAARAYLFLGFGAEARNLIREMQPVAAADPLMIGISYLVDGEQAPDNPFAGMHTCNSAAAFWALAAADGGDDLAGLDGGAVARTFMAMPAHLKMAFAQTIADRLIKAGDQGNAEIIRTALNRAAPEGATIVPLMEAEIALHESEPEEAEAHLDTIADAAFTAEALMALVEARFQKREPVDANDLLALQAFAFEQNESDRAAKLRRALAHGQALSGDFSSAFATAEEAIDLRSDIWALLSEMGQNSDVLTHVVGGTVAATDKIAPETRVIFVRRLIDLGLPEAARAWLEEAKADPALTAEVALANRDGRLALRALAEDLDEADAELLAAAFQQTGDYTQAAATLRMSGDTTAASRLERWSGIWENPQTEGSMSPEENLASAVPDEPEVTDMAWTQLAALRQPIPQDANAAPLEQGQKHLENSSATRTRITDLLASVPPVK